MTLCCMDKMPIRAYAKGDMMSDRDTVYCGVLIGEHGFDKDNLINDFADISLIERSCRV